MAQIASPEKTQLVKDLVDLLVVLNRADQRDARYRPGWRRTHIPRRQLNDRAAAVAQYLLCLEVDTRPQGEPADAPDANRS